MICTTEQIINQINEDLIWRRKELTELRAMVQSSKGQLLRSQVLARCAVALLYAHWEGFVKKCSAYYIEYVASHRLPHKELAANFLALILKSKFIELQANEKISGGNDLADFFCSELDRQSNLPYKKGIDTKSNLTSKVLIDILQA